MLFHLSIDFYFITDKNTVATVENICRLIIGNISNKHGNGRDATQEASTSSAQAEGKAGEANGGSIRAQKIDMADHAEAVINDGRGASVCCGKHAD